MTVTIKFRGCDLVCTGNFSPSEPSQMYDENMEGHPGSAAEFELMKVKLAHVDVTELLEDYSDEITNLCIEQLED